MFIEINLRETKLLLFGIYHSPHAVYGSKNEDYYQEVGQALDVYSNYEKLLLAGDFNGVEGEDCLSDFLYEYIAWNLVIAKTCISLDNPSSIDIFLTNSHQSFQNTIAVFTGLSDFHKMAVTVRKTTFPKAKQR